jgi:YVTN family beta-propeller protein
MGNGARTDVLMMRTEKILNCSDREHETITRFGGKNVKRHLIVLVSFAVIFLMTAAALGSDRFAFVTSEGDNDLSVIDLNAEKVITTLPTGKTPHALTFTSHGKGYVNNRGSRTLTVIDGNKFRVMKTIALPAISMLTALSPDQKTLAVVYKDALKVSFIDTTTDEITKTMQVGKEPEGVFKGAMMRHPYWSKDGGFLYVSDDVNNDIVKIDVKTKEVRAVIPLPGTNHYLHPTADARLLYAVNEAEPGGKTSVTVIDSKTDRIVKDIPVPLESGEKGLLHHGVFTRDGRYFFVCNVGGRTVAVIDTGKLEVVKTIRTGMGAGHPAMTKDGKYLYVIEHKDNTVAVIDVGKQTVVKNIPVGIGKKQAHASYFSPDGRFFYMVNAADNRLIKIDTAKMEVVSEIPVGRSSMFFSVKEGKEFPATE